MPGRRGGSKKNLKKAQIQIVTRWVEYFGEESKLENWQKLCHDLGVYPVPTSLTKCRKVCLPSIFPYTSISTRTDFNVKHTGIEEGHLGEHIRFPRQLEQ